ncbi:hypothetical protein EJ357_00550 [Streptomyces cyaneochromogenes]|uniref:NACHT domain-containing protein n=1 Tax=Streptomyces cyaneochromogenes TaxID=2496836 RepID=A0A3Q9EN93_9ACTN|nr:hypothetical protein [Streptomyces cyaneochromogenes]AZQ32152.1 hypothetical protein EJ357_00550 [Streptomyces cyaneochromogenes]
MVVLGEPGSGKTVMAIRFVLRALERRAPGGPVPVLFSLSGWQPHSETLDDWLVRLWAATPQALHGRVNSSQPGG